jgi:Sulfotransferase family
MEQLNPYASTPAPSRVKVLYIIGAPRCGSTVLDNILNEIDGFFSAGELRFLWQRMDQGRFCGCGKAFETCEIWAPVLEKVAGSDPAATARVVMARQKRVAGTWRTWQLLHRMAKGTMSAEALAHADLMGSLYEAIRTVTGAGVIVDSSKRPWDAALLSAVPNVEPFFVHLVRDPRAMAYSQSKIKANPDRSQPGTMAPTGISASAFQWIRRNLAADAVRRAEGPGRSMLIDYHDFCQCPREMIGAITALVGQEDTALPFSDDHTVTLGGNHTVSGNPDRFRLGQVPVREDNRWKDKMSRRDRSWVTALTLPLMLRYSKATRRARADMRPLSGSPSGDGPA